MIRIAWGLLFAAAAAAQTTTDADRVLERAKVRLSDAAAATPKYTCTETVDREYFVNWRARGISCDKIVADERTGKAKPVVTATDRLRFDVEVADGGYEIYAWPGSSRIATERVEEMAGGGPLGTGPFGPFLTDIFANPGVTFLFTTVRGGQLEYRYRVPLAASHYRVQANGTWRFTPYDGTFRLDSETAELKQLTVRTAELPADTGNCEATTTMEFTPLHIGSGDYLIPSATRLHAIGRSGITTENSTVYSACHEFSVESAVRFDAEEPRENRGFTTSAPVRRKALPPGLPVLIVLDNEIDTARAAAGDVVAAKIGKPVIDPLTKQELLPAGTPLRGRITHLEHHVEGQKYYLVGVSFETFPLMLDASHGVPPPPALDFGRAAAWIEKRTIESHSGLRSGGMLYFPTDEPRYFVPRGYVSNWVTVPQ